MNQIDQALEAMSPAELSELEREIDKQAADSKVAYHFQTGVKLAQEAVELFKTTGEISPIFSLLTEPKVAAAEGSLDADLDKCSAEELVSIEKALDEKLAEAKTSDEYAARYFDMGVKMARQYVADIQKEAAGKIPKPRGKKAPGVQDPAVPTLGSRLKDISTNHPVATGAAALGAGYLLGDRR